MRANVIISAILSIFVIFMFGCSGGGTGDTTDDSSTGINIEEPLDNLSSVTLISGIIVDGPIRNAIVCMDINSNKVCDTDEPTATTADDGTFTLSLTEQYSGEYTIISVGGIDTATNQLFEGILEEIVELSKDDENISTTITPLTTLASKIYEDKKATDSSYTPTKAKEQLATSLGLSTQQISLNPLEDIDVFSTTQKIVQATRLLTTTIQADNESTDTNQEIFNNVLTQVAISLKDTTSNDLNITMIVQNLNNTHELNISNDMANFVQDYVAVVEDKIGDSTDSEQLSTLQNGLEIYTAQISLAIENSTDASTIVSELDIKLQDMSSTALDTIIEQAVAKKSVAVRSVPLSSDALTDGFITTQCGDLGGIAIYTGIDSNADGVLGEGEQSDTPQVVCNGASGIDGESGEAPTVSMEQLAVGDPQCSEGGIKLTIGTQDSYLCNGSSATDTAVDLTAPGSISGTVPSTLTPSPVFKSSFLKSPGLGGAAGLSLLCADFPAPAVPPAAPQTSSVPQSVVEPIEVDISADGTYNIPDLPSGEYGLIYEDGNGNGQKIDNIFVLPGINKVTNIDNPTPTGSVTLQVSSLNGELITNAKVRLNDLNIDESVSSTTAEVTFDKLPSGNYSITISADGYVEKYQTFNIISGGTTDIGTVNLNSQKGKLSGSVNVADIEDLSNIVVYAKGADGTIYTTLTNTSGNYVFNAIAVDDGYSVLAYAHDYTSQKVDGIDIKLNETTVASTIILTRLSSVNSIVTASISGFARYSSVNDSLNNAGIIISLESTDYEAITARDGSFILNNIPDGNYTLNITDSNHVPQTRDITVISGAMSSINDISLIPKVGDLIGKVVDEAGVGVENANIIILTSTQTITATTDSSGGYSVNGILSGTHEVLASKDGYGAGLTIVTIIEGEETNTISKPIEITRKLLTGVILLQNSLDSAGAIVQLTGSDISQTTTLEDGNFTLYGVGAGSYQLQITKDGYITQLVPIAISSDDGYAIPYTIEMIESLGTLSGVVSLDSTNNSGVLVSLENTTFTTVTNTLGAWSMTLPIGQYSNNILFTHPDYDSAVFSDGFIVEASNTKSLNDSIVMSSLTGSVIIKVIDDALNPVANVNVQASNGVTFTTSSDGVVTLSAIEVGDRRITASKDGYTTESVNITVLAGDTVDASLSPITLTRSILSGVIDVVNSDDNIATLTLLGSDIGDFSSNVDGSFSLYGVSAGSYQLQVSKSGYATVTQVVVILDNSGYTLPNTISLLQSVGTLSGSIILPNSSNYSGIIINVAGYSAVTNMIGNWSIDLPEGTYDDNISFTDANYQSITLSDSFTIASSQTTTVPTQTLSSKIGSITGIVKDGSGVIVSNASISISTSSSTITGFTDTNGVFILEGVEIGTFTIVASKTDFGTDSRSVLIEPDTQTNISADPLVLQELTLSGSVDLDGVSDESGASISLVGSSLPTATTDINGDFTISGVGAGIYEVQISKTGYVTKQFSIIVSGDTGYAIAETIVLSQATGILSGVVTLSNETDSSGVSVSIEGTTYTTVTNKLGIWSMELPIDSYTNNINFTHALFETYVYSSLFDIETSKETKLQDITLASKTSTITGIVKDSDGNLLTGATVVTDDGSHTSSSGGDFTITGVPVGARIVTATLDGYGSSNITLDLNSTSSADVGVLILTPYTLTGNIILEGAVADGHAGALVNIIGANSADITTADGSFSISGLAPKSYQIQVSRDGYVTSAMYLVTVENNITTLDYNITLSQAKGTLSGIVNLDGTSDNSGVFVNLSNIGLSTVTNALGQFSISLPTGIYSDDITFTNANYVDNPYTNTFEINATSETYIGKITLSSKTSTITGIVKDTDGNLLTGATIVTDDGSDSVSLTGAFTISSVPIGTKTVTATLDGYGSFSTTVELNSTSSADAGILTLSPYTLSGVVSLESAAVDGHAGATVNVIGANNSDITISDGSFSISGLSPKSYQIQVSKDGYVTSDMYLVEIDELNSTLDYNITLSQAKGTLSGIVNLDGTNDNSGVSVSIGSIGSVTTNSLGVWSINLAVNTYADTIQYSISNYQTLTDTSGFEINASTTTNLNQVSMNLNLGTLTGKVVDDLNNTLADASIAIVGGVNTYSVDTNATGEFSVDVVVGEYLVTAMKTGYGYAQESNVTIVYNATNNSLHTTPMQLVSNTITGTIDVEDLANNQTGVDITLTNLSDSTTSAGVINADGSFTINAVKNGNYKLEITHTDTNYKTTTLELYNVDEDGYIFATAILVEKKKIAKDYDLLIYDYIRNSNDSNISNIRYNLNLPTIMTNGSSVSWASDDTSLISNDGLVSLPLSTQTNTLNLTATISYDGEIDRDKSIALSVAKDYQPYMSSSATFSVDEDFGYLFKSVKAQNINEETISYAISNIVNGDLVDKLEIDTNTGEISVKSKENTNGVVTFDVIATSGTPTLSATNNLTLNITAVADTLTADAGATQTVSPSSLVTLDSSASIDTDGDATYTWTLTNPAGSTSSLSNSSVSNPTFTPDVTGTYTAELNITNDAGSSISSTFISVLPIISVDNISVIEGDSAVFTISISTHDNEVTLDYTTEDITAEVFKDYQKISGSLTFASGETSKTVTIPTTADYLPEASEEFKLVINNISGTTQTSIEATCSLEYSPFELAYLNGENGFKILNATKSMSSAKTVNKAGDFNGDGIDDYLISSTDNDIYKGSVYLIYGSTSNVELGEYDLSTADLIITGAATYDRLGVSMDAIGDFNGDGFDDIIIGAPYSDPQSRTYAGTSYILYGGGLTGTLDITTLNDTLGVKIEGAVLYDYSAYSVSGAGDVNGDGFSDVIVGAFGAEAAYIIYGGQAVGITGVVDLLSYSSYGIKISGTAGDYTGYSVDGGEDINGDGYSDILIGSPYLSSRTGAVYIVYGGDLLNDITLSSLGSAGVTISGIGTYDYSGYSVGMLGDINGDGYSDIQFSSVYGSNSYVVFGGELLNGIVSVSLSSLDGSDGCKMIEPINSIWGSYFAGTGSTDINGDGINDLLFGVNRASPNGNESGQGYVIYGDTSICGSGTLTLDNLNGSNGFALNGISGLDRSFHTFKHLGDINGDGFDDIGISSYESEKFYVVYGGDHTSSVTDNLISNTTLIGTQASEIVVGSYGTEAFISNGGSDVFIGGPGNDIITVSDLNFKKIDGGNGFDTLIINVSGESIDLTTLKPKQLENIEVISFNGDGPNTIILNKAVALRLSSNHLEAGVYNTNFLMIEAGIDDKIEFSDSQDWIYTTGNSLSMTGISDVFTSSVVTTYVNGDVKVYADSDIAIIPEIVASDVSVLEDAGVVTFTIKRTNGVYESSIDYSIVDGTASNNPVDDNDTSYDYYGVDGNLTFYKGELIKSISIRLIKDDKLEADKTFTVSLSNINNATFRTGSETSTVTIIDDQIGLQYLDGVQGLSISPEAAYDGIGKFVSSAGDVNGDGYEDIIIGVDNSYDIFLVYGGTNLSNTAELSLGDTSKRVKIKATSYSYDLSVSGLGDVNGDGYDDFSVGYISGEIIYVVFGAADISGGDNYLDLVNENTGFIKLTSLDNDSAGYDLSAAGDINGDGYDDILIGAYLADPNTLTNSGRTYVVFGKASWNDLDITTLDGSNGFIIDGIASDDYLGNSISGGGDVNGDGYDDIIIGAYRADVDLNSDGLEDVDVGEVYIIFGEDTVGSTGNFNPIDLNGSNGITIIGEAATDQAGYSVSMAGDINGDGYDDILIGANSVYGTSNDGAVYVVYGATSISDTNLSTLDGTTGFKILGNTEDFLGFVAGNGDINGDGKDDIVVSSTNHIVADVSKIGAVYVIYGGTVSSATFDLANINTSYGFMIEGSIASQNFGYGTSLNGDYNGDGFADLLIGAHDSGSIYSSGGQTYLIYGRDFLGRASYVGTSGNDSHQEANSNYYFYMLQGDDYLSYYSGPQTIFMGQGDDRAHSYGFSGDSGIGKMLGGRGLDTLSFSYFASSLDFTTYKNNRIKGFEIIDLSQTTSATALTMSKLDIFGLLDTDKHIFYVKGESTDSVTITDGVWTSLGNTLDGYNTWELNNSPIKLKIDINIGTVTIP